MEFSDIDKKNMKKMYKKYGQKLVSKIIKKQDKLKMSRSLRSTLQKIRDHKGGMIYDYESDMSNYLPKDNSESPIYQQGYEKALTENPLYIEGYNNAKQDIGTENPTGNHEDYPIYQLGYEDGAKENPLYQEGFNDALHDNSHKENPIQPIENKDNSYQENPLKPLENQAKDLQNQVKQLQNQAIKIINNYQENPVQQVQNEQMPVHELKFNEMSVLPTQNNLQNINKQTYGQLPIF